ncbi:MAG: aminotransferase DegT [Lachnospiraceae bacterium]|nr:aminotransferase DegT [Lachnospiraceae bacterium]MCI9623954.1 aminotransferase DegT [Lachnospiraceae bacterium]
MDRFQEKVWLSSPTMHGDEKKYMLEAYETNWMSTVGKNIDELEHMMSAFIGVPYGVALSSGTAALHLAVKLAAERLYGSSSGVSTPDGLGRGGSLYGRRVFCSDMTFDATVNPVVYEGGEPVFIDTEYDTWNMSPKALEQAFSLYPDVKLVIMAHLYGTPGRVEEIRSVCDAHQALLIEDAAESLGATYCGRQTGVFGDYSIVSFNGNKIITGSSGGMLLCHSEEEANKARKWSTQSREAAPWYQHEELGYNYRMSNVIAGVVRGQFGYLSEHIEQKKRIYERYREGLKDLPVQMNPFDAACSEPNHWLSCLLIDADAMCESVRSEKRFTYKSEKGKSCPDEILEALGKLNAEGRPVWKPMHMQPVYRSHGFVTAGGNGRAKSNAYIKEMEGVDAGADIFRRGLCLPSDNKMTAEQQEKIVAVIKNCFG